MAARGEGLYSSWAGQVAVAPRGSGSGWVGDDPGSRIESNREKGPKRERRPVLRHAKKKRQPVGFYPGGLLR